MTIAADTTPEAEQILIDLLRRAPIWRKLEMMGQLNAMVKSLAEKLNCPKTINPNAGILRLVNLAARQQGPVWARILESHGKELQAGAIITADGHRLRIRPPGQ